MRVHLGEHNLRKRDGTEQLRTVTRIVPHPGYVARTHLHDLMLLRLARPALVSAQVRPVSLPTRCPQAGDPCVVSGWGLVSAYESETTGSPESPGAWSAGARCQASGTLSSGALGQREQGPEKSVGSLETPRPPQ